MTLEEVDAAFAELAATSGKGASAVRAERLAALFSRATVEETGFSRPADRRRAAAGRVEGADARSRSRLRRKFPSPRCAGPRCRPAAWPRSRAPRSRRALAGLARFSIRLMQPVLPMLSQSADSVDEALERLGTAAFEWKLDGARVQVHKSGDEVRCLHAQPQRRHRAACRRSSRSCAPRRGMR